MPSINDIDTILNRGATPQTPNQIRMSGNGFAPSINDIDQILKQQVVQPQTPQQIIQTGIQQPVQKVVPGEEMFKPAENAGFLKKAGSWLLNTFLPTQSMGVVARDITANENEQLKNQIISDAQNTINLFNTRITDAEAKGDVERANRLRTTLADTIQKTNDLLGEDVFQKPTTLQTVGALADIAATAAAPFVPAKFATTKAVGTMLKPVVTETGMELARAGTMRAAGGLGRAALETGLAAAPVGATFAGGRTLAETGDIDKAAVAAIVGAPFGFGTGAVTPLATRGLGLFGSKVIAPMVDKVDEAMGGKLGSGVTKMIWRGLVKPLNTTLEKLGLKNVTKDLENVFLESKRIKGAAQAQADKAVSRFEKYVNELGEEEAIRRYNEGLFLSGKNSLSPNAPHEPLEVVLKQTDDPVAKTAILDTYNTSAIVDAPVAKFGKIYTNRSRLPQIEGGFILPAEKISVNDLREELAGLGYKYSDVDQIISNIEKDVKVVYNKEKQFDIAEFTNMPGLRDALRKELPKYSKMGEGATPEVAVVKEGPGKPVVTAAEGFKPAPTGIKIYIEGEKIPVTKIRRQAEKPVPRLITPVGGRTRDEMHEALVQNVMNNDPRISKIADLSERRLAAEAKIDRENLGIEAYSRWGQASARQFTFDTPQEAAEAGWLLRKPQDYKDMLYAMIDQNADDAAKYTTLLKAPKINESTGRPVDPDAQLRKYVDDIVEKVRIATKAVQQSESEGIRSSEFVRGQLNAILGVGQSAEERDLYKALATIKQLGAAKLTTSFIANAFQPLNSLLAADLPSFAKGFASMLHITSSPMEKYTAQEFATLTGAKAGTIVEPFNIFKGNKEQATAWRRFINKIIGPFKWTEVSLNRTHAANTGAFYAIRQFKKGNFGEVAKYLGESDTTSAILRGFLNEDDLIKIGSNFMDYTQFGFNPLELPTAFNNEWGSAILQFKSFGYRQAKFLFDEILRGDARALRNLAIITTIYPPLGMAQNVLKRIITGRALTEGLTDEDKSFLGLYIEGALNTGVMSIIGDAITAGLSGRGVAWAMGPTAGTIGGGIETAVRAGAAIGAGDIEKAADLLAKFMTSQAGGGGRGVYNLGKWLWDDVLDLSLLNPLGGTAYAAEIPQTPEQFIQGAQQEPAYALQKIKDMPQYKRVDEQSGGIITKIINLLSPLFGSHTINVNNKPTIDNKLAFDTTKLKDPSILENGKSIDTLKYTPKQMTEKPVINNNATNLKEPNSKTVLQKFNSPEEGIRASAEDLNTKLSGGGNIVQSILSKENIDNPTVADMLRIHESGTTIPNKKSDSYVNNIQKWTGLDLNQPIIDFPKELYALLMKGMMRYESPYFFQKYRNLVDNIMQDVVGVEQYNPSNIK